MNKKENGFSLVIVVIFMSIAALFVGYLMGSWLISFLVDDTSSQLAEEEISENTAPQIVQNRGNNEEEINNSENNLTAPPAENEQNSSQPAENIETPAAEETAPAAENSESSEPAQEESSAAGSEADQNTDIAGGFGVQIGAFSNYNNALNLQENIEAMGYNVVITDSSPHQVQVVGYASREEAETAAAELEAEGYNGFIVIRE